MTRSLSAALTEIAGVIDGLSGIRAATANPPEAVSQFPYATVYNYGAKFGGRPTGSMLQMFDIRADLLIPSLNITRAFVKLSDLAPVIPNALFKKQRTASPGGWTSFDTVGDEISMTPPTATKWAGLDLIMLRYSFQIKILGVLT